MKLAGTAELAVHPQALPGPVFRYAQEADMEPQNPDNRTVFKIPQYRLEWLDQRIAALNKVAAKLNLDPVGYNVLQEIAEPDPTDEFGIRTRHFVEIELYGETPQLKTPSGHTYRFLSRIMHGEGGNIIKSIPGVELPDQYRTIEPLCQHCNTRRRRNDTYVLEDSDSGQLVQVGSTCLRDFLGHESANSYAAWAEALADMNLMLEDAEGGYDEGMGGGGGARTYGIEQFLEMTYACSKMFGWMGRATARERGEGVATVDQALNLYHSRDRRSREDFAKMMAAITAEDKDMLSAALEWARELKEGGSEDIDRLSDYYWNLSIACSSPVVNPSTEGIVASLPIAYNKAVLSKIQPNATVVVGNKGELWVGTGVLEDENIYGTENSYRMRTEDNKIVQWTGSPVDQVVGSPINIQGTIVGYSRYFNNVTTRLARVKILSDEEFAVARSEVATAPELGDQPEYRIGEKVTVDVAILSVRDITTDYGMSTLYTMTDPWGNVLKWFSSGGVDFEQGERLNITATVKKMDEWQGQPQVVLTRCKVNSRELPEGQEDPRMTPQEEKAAKSQLSKLKRQLAKLQATIGVKDQQDLYAQSNQVIDPIRQHLNRIRYVVPQSDIRSLDNENLIQNHASVSNMLTQYLPMALQKAQERQEFVERERPDSYEVTSNRMDIERIQNNISTVPQAVAEFSQLAVPFLERQQAFTEASPQMNELTQQIEDLENRFRKHRDAVKTWGKRASSWLIRIARGQ